MGSVRRQEPRVPANLQRPVIEQRFGRDSFFSPVSFRPRSVTALPVCAWSKAVDANGNTLAYDQRGTGFGRIVDGTVDGTVDIGALEVQPQVVQIDVKPGSDPNSINLANQGVISVAIFTTANFDAANVNVSTVVWAGANVAQKNDGSLMSALEDVDGDGDLDLVVHFHLAETNLLDVYENLLRDDLTDGTLDSFRQSVDIALEGLTNDGVSPRGSDTVDLFLAGKALRELLNELGRE